MNDTTKYPALEQLSAAARSAGQACADVLTVAFGSAKAARLRREADAVDVRVAEAKARLEARRG